MIAGDANLVDPWTTLDNNNNNNGNLTEAQLIWRERERRQRTVRFFMMFLLMLLLMDGEEQNQRRRSREHQLLRERLKRQTAMEQPLPRDLFAARGEEEELLKHASSNSPRYQALIEKIEGKDHYKLVQDWAIQQQEVHKDEFAHPNEQAVVEDGWDVGPDGDQEVWHYPWNATGFFRGDWATNSTRSDEHNDIASEQRAVIAQRKRDLDDLGTAVVGGILASKRQAGVYLLPEGLELLLPNVTDSETGKSSSSKGQKKHRASSGSRQPHNTDFLRGSTALGLDPPTNLDLPLTKDSGRVAFQLYARPVPAMQELSILEGFVKLYDSNSIGYSTRRDVLLRVRGVTLHSIGRVSLVSSTSEGRGVLLIPNMEVRQQRQRKLLESVQQQGVENVDLERLRDEVIELFPMDEHEQHSMVFQSEELVDLTSDISAAKEHWTRRKLTEAKKEPLEVETLSQERSTNYTRTKSRSKHVIPWPFVPDDIEQTVRLAPTPANRVMPPREQLLEKNAGACEFEIGLDIQEEKRSIGKWRRAVAQKLMEMRLLDPTLHSEEKNDEAMKQAGSKRQSGGNRKKTPMEYQDHTLVMTMNGTISSFNCNFEAKVNVTAIRINWENTTGKAINYSFFMMLTCLTQIVLMLRQLLHTQASSAASRVSLLCIGWQTVLDALFCLVHIYLSLAMQPLFTAFASVAFFKLLQFSVIGMKYLAIILAARNSNNGGNTIELLRRQIAMLHLRFYVALIFSFLMFFYAWDNYRTLYILALYSFWVPQIVQNVVTEAKRPLHQHYVHGISVTRLVAPIYIFGTKDNFLKEIYPESPTNVFMCELLVAWVFVQAAMLEAQARYGARFMIPARFLPPKFDYSRPIPQYLLPEGIKEEDIVATPSEVLQLERGPAPEMDSTFASSRSTSRSSGVTRNRIKGSRMNRTESEMTTEVVSAPQLDPTIPSFDCVICYNEIDTRNRRGYMLAPCDHIFHRDCLVQWMEVKMECPTCRAALPAL